jgi:hypothetical protein
VGSQAKKNRTGRPPTYRWAEWFARPKVLLTRGKDYRCSQSAMVAQIRNAATKHGKNVVVQDQLTKIEMTVVDQE